MDWKPHLPLAIATAALIIAMSTCTYLVLGALDEISNQLIAINVNTDGLPRK